MLLTLKLKKLVDNFTSSVVVRSNRDNHKQVAKNNAGTIQQAGGDIHNVYNDRSNDQDVPYLYLSGTRFGSGATSEAAKLGGHLTNASDKHLFVDSIKLFGKELKPINLSVPPQSIERFTDMAAVYGSDADENQLQLFYSDTSGNRYMSMHKLTLQQHGDKKFGIAGVESKRPAIAVGRNTE